MLRQALNATPTYGLARTLLFRLDPETAHGLTLRALAAAHAAGEGFAPGVIVSCTEVVVA